MVAVGVFLLVAHILILLEGALLVVGSIAAFTGATFMVVSGILTLILWLPFVAFTIRSIRFTPALLSGNGERPDSALSWASWILILAAFLSFTSGLPLAFLAFASCGPLFVSSLDHWTGMAGMAVSFGAYYLLPVVVNGCTDRKGSVNRRWWSPIVFCVPGVLAWGLTWIVVYAKLSGSIDEKAYPSRDGSPYRLPFPGGESSWVIQGNNSSLNHNGTQQFAWDFRRSCGTPVLAARGGIVTKVDDGHDGNGSGQPNNRIVVDHGDGTSAEYLHFQFKSAKVKEKQKVNQGDELALVGNVGNSLTGHIRFQVDKGSSSIAIVFADPDVKDDQGIPRTFSSYESSNRK
jgi:hypothetical protein